MTTTSSRLVVAAGASSGPITPALCPARRSALLEPLTRRAVQVRVEVAGGLRRQPGHRLELLARRAERGLRRAEVLEQRALALGPDAGQAVEHGLGHLPVAALAVMGDREAMRLVAQALQELQLGRVVGQA